MFLFTSKDEVYYFLIRLSKRWGLELLQEHFSFIDRFLPLPHIERHGIELRQLTTINQHESGVNQVAKISDKQLVTISDDCSLKLWKTTSTGTVGG